MLKTPIISRCFSIRLNPSFHPLIISLAFSAMSSSASKVVAEYAKSGRSSCKTCSKHIPVKSLRLGLVTKDPRGYDATKWHHTGCFRFSSDLLPSANAISGFSSLESSDQEELTKLISEGAMDKAEVSEKDESAKKENRKRMITQETDGKEDTEQEEERIKIAKVSDKDENAKKENRKRIITEAPETDGKEDTEPEEEKMKMAKMSSSASKVVAEYAKSGRSSCKKCSKLIPAKSLRLGLVTKAPQGYDTTKWHHVGCFPLNSDILSSANAISGFSSLESNDQEELKKLISEGTTDKDEVSDKDESAKKENRKRMITEAQETDGKEDTEQEEKKIKIAKLSHSIEGPELEIAFSVTDVKSHYKDAKLLPKWKAFQTTIYLERDEGLLDSEKIAAFDFDGCLVKTSVKITGPDAWSLMNPSVPEKLQSLYNDGYKLVIFTNESNIDRWKKQRQKAVDSKIGRLEGFIKRVNVPIQVFIACGSTAVPADPFRKPNIGMWNLLKNHFNSGLPIDMDKSFYVGDAAGRENDHSDADIKFAEAIGLKFYLPEEFFIA